MNSMGMDSRVLVREVSMAKRAAAALASGSAATMPKAFCWFGQMMNQQKALGIVAAEPEAKAAAARLAMLTSRTNTMLSIPMLFMMVAQSHGGL